MNNTRIINEEVSVTSVYFRPGRHLKGFPKRMEYGGREYTFIESGLRYLVRKGQQLIEIFDMTDGTRDYRLKFDTVQQSWTLIGVRENSHVAA
ncbi:MAG TPA: hypothetical protein VF572_04855 [Candidatus Saccharimonadales bacterium]|jgi:hypothetical protein